MKEEVQKWWKVALEDLGTSKYNLEGNKLAAAALYAQQAAEKGLKTLLLHGSTETLPLRINRFLPF